MKVLYLSYDGMTDPLGSSQVLPYIIGLAHKGVSYTLVSFEKKGTFDSGKSAIEDQIKSLPIEWIPLSYTKYPPVISTLWDIYKLSKHAKFNHKKTNYDIVHCRSYITSLIGLRLKIKFDVKFIFDMRGFYADERVDGGIWKLSNPVFKLIFGYFKKKEVAFLENADHTISLTYKAKEIIHTFPVENNPVPISVIPTCVDTDTFNTGNIDYALRSSLISELSINQESFVLSYVGSLGTWYMVEEMILLFKELLKKIPRSVFLFITKDSPEAIYKYCEKHGVSLDKIAIKGGKRNEMPTLISLSNWSIFFIKPVFSKSASAPTKLAELINMGVPVICNLGVGDIDLFFEKYQMGYAIDKFDNGSFLEAIDFILNNQNLNIEKKLVSDEFKLDNAVDNISSIYTFLKHGSSNVRA